ncbi:MAG: flagellin [Bacteriovoracales bacterium]
MGLRINTNVPSLAAQRSLRNTNESLSDNLSRLSSGRRIVKSADDAAGMAISSRLTALIRGNYQAERNANDGISLVQIAEGGLNEGANILTRMRELAIQAASDTIGDPERALADKEYQQIKMELDRISRVTEYNGAKLLDGSAGQYDIQVGVRNDPFNDRISWDASQINATLDRLGVGGLDLLSKEAARNSLSSVDTALGIIAENRATLGAVQNRLQSTIQNLQIAGENLSAANSRILDAVYAKEISENARLNVLANAGVSALAATNQRNNLVLKLLG